MVMIAVICPYCNSSDVCKNGCYANGTQRYICKNTDCTHRTFPASYTYKGNDPKIKESICDHIVNGNGTRATARILGVSKNTVTSVLKKLKSTFP